MAHTGLFVAPVPGTPPVGMSPTDGRIGLAALVGVQSQLVDGGGFTPSATLMQGTVAQAVWEITDPTNSAAAFFSPTDSTLLTFGAAPGTGGRIDSVVVKQNNIENGDADSRVNVYIVAGVASGSPLPPAVPAGAAKYLDVLISAGQTNLAAATVTNYMQTVFGPAWLNAPSLAALNATTGQPNQHATVAGDSTPANNGDYFWNASATQWVKAERSGLVPVVPSSVAGSGVTVGANGVVSFAAATAISVNGVFSTKYDNYLILFDMPTGSASAGGTLRLRVGGTDDTGADYSYQQSWAAASAVNANNAGGVAQWGAFPVAGVEASAEWKMFDPALAKPTRIQIHGSMWSNATTGVDSSMSGRHTLSTAYDGFTYTPSAGNVTGTLRVYGYNNL